MRTHRTITSCFILSGTLVAAGAMFSSCDRGSPSPQPVPHEPPAQGMAQPPATDAPNAPRAADPASAHDETVVASFLGLRALRPATWIEQPPQSAMHHTTFTTPGADGHADAQIVVFYFGPGQGGPIDANIQRWTNQFRSPAGSDAEAEVRRFEADGLPVTLVELEGEYRGMGTIYTPDQRFITAIVDAPGHQRIFIRFVGDHATVTAHRDAFIAMIEGIELAGE